MRTTERGARRLLVPLVLSALLAPPAAARAQVAPNDEWRTITTPHFRITFPRNIEPLARRAAGEAERAWARLAAELTPPRTPVDLVLSDNQDASNGQAMFFPSNRIVIWARPPIDVASLRFGDDWLQQVITHELAHVFHLDRSRGMWRLGQWVFGRHPALFPNARSPRWLMEGIAIEYESRLGGGGRLGGTELYTTLDAVTAGDPSLLTPPRLSLSAPYWPAGDLAYFAGARFVAEAVKTGGDGSLRRFIERGAVFPIPYMWDLAARHAFGASFGTAGGRDITGPTNPLPADTAKALSGPYWELRSPRWVGDTVFFVAVTPRETPALYAIRNGAASRVARRNNVDAFGIANGRFVYAQLDFTDPYRLYSALYSGDDKIAGSMRLVSPDVRADGAIVAVETAEGAARLVVLDTQGRRLRALGDMTPDIQWSAPRWSRSGTKIAAIRWMRGGESELVVLDTVGGVLASYGRARAVLTHPSWDVDDRAVYFTSDATGRAATYRARIATAPALAAEAVEFVAGARFGLYEAEVSPDGTQLAASRLGPHGYELVVRSMLQTSAARARLPVVASTRDSIVTAGGPARRYSAFRTLIPRYWVPTLGTSSRDNVLPGFHTSGTDVVGRHFVAFDGAWDVKSGDFYGDALWSFRGFGRPVVTTAFSQGWTFFDVFDADTNAIGKVSRRNHVASLSLAFSRPRLRSSAFFSIGSEFEWRRFRAQPESLAAQIDPPLPGTLKFPALVVSASWSNVTQAPLSLGPQDGVLLTATGRRRWRTDDQAGTAANSVIGVARAYKSLSLGGHARHVAALRGAFGWAEPNITSLFSAGGVSGTSLELVPGYTIGDAQRSFFVRGFPSGALTGIRAWGATAEYRAPLPRIGRGLWPLPLFFQRTSLALFADGASAWCPVRSEDSVACRAEGTPRTAIASAGGELVFDTALAYDSPTRFRVGVAAPVRGRAAVDASQATFYFTLGFPF